MQVSLPEKSMCSHIFKSPSMSSATTTDEDFLTGSPKQRWADLSEEDDDLFMMERSPFGFLEDGKDMTLDSMAACEDKKNMADVGNDMHDEQSGITNGSSPNVSEKEQLGTLVDRKQSRPMGCLGGEIAPFTMLPPSIDSRTAKTQASMAAPRSLNSSANDIFIVTLSGIPLKLCNKTCLDAILWASGVQRSSLGYHTKKNGHIVINFGTLDAATHCCNHFKSCSWATGKLQVVIVHPGSHQTTDKNMKLKQYQKSFASVNQSPGKHTKLSFAQQMW